MQTIVSTYHIKIFNQDINNIYNILSPLKSLADKINWASQYFLGKPYQMGASGEGPTGQFDQNPLYRTDVFDCVTFINTVLALAISSNLTDFKKKLVKINYYHNIAHYQNRYHFMCVDWIPENIKAGLIKDITMKIQDDRGQPVAEMAIAEINRPNWFLHRNLTDLKLIHSVSALAAQKLLLKLRSCSKQVCMEISRLPYVPFTKLFIHGKPDTFLFDQIPHGAVVSIVRPAWDLRDKIGTHLNISHVGFVLRQKNNIVFRHAAQNQCVQDVSLPTYLYKTCLPNPTIRGIHILEPLI